MLELLEDPVVASVMNLPAKILLTPACVLLTCSSCNGLLNTNLFLEETEDGWSSMFMNSNHLPVKRHSLSRKVVDQIENTPYMRQIVEVHAKLMKTKIPFALEARADIWEEFDVSSDERNAIAAACRGIVDVDNVSEWLIRA
eukprot:Pompholyxophrys_punicea_v1_NODE_1038_length_1021_cov_4.249482.p1 type:complete len:142 gc:universal NODE_1038_length_1021_cov_4.249482:479-904(+)